MYQESLITRSTKPSPFTSMAPPPAVVWCPVPTVWRTHWSSPQYSNQPMPPPVPLVSIVEPAVPGPPPPWPTLPAVPAPATPLPIPPDPGAPPALDDDVAPDTELVDSPLHAATMETSATTPARRCSII